MDAETFKESKEELGQKLQTLTAAIISEWQMENSSEIEEIKFAFHKKEGENSVFWVNVLTEDDV